MAGIQLKSLSKLQYVAINQAYDNSSLHEPLMTQITDAYRSHQPAMC